MYSNGKGVSESFQEANKWFLQPKDSLYASAKSGDAYAQFAPEDMYEYGLGVAEDAHAAMRWYEKANLSF